MSLTVGELRDALEGMPDTATVHLIFNGVLRNAAGVTVEPKGGITVIRSHGQMKPYKRYSVAEDGLIGGLNAMGMSDETIAELIDRTPESVKRRRKSIGLS